MLFRIRYYIRIHILYLVRTDVPNCACCYKLNFRLYIQKYFSLKENFEYSYPLIYAIGKLDQVKHSLKLKILIILYFEKKYVCLNPWFSRMHMLDDNY